MTGRGRPGPELEEDTEDGVRGPQVVDGRTERGTVVMEVDVT